MSHNHPEILCWGFN